MLTYATAQVLSEQGDAVWVALRRGFCPNNTADLSFSHCLAPCRYVSPLTYADVCIRMLTYATVSRPAGTSVR